MIERIPPFAIALPDVDGPARKRRTRRGRDDRQFDRQRHARGRARQTREARADVVADDAGGRQHGRSIRAVTRKRPGRLLRDAAARRIRGRGVVVVVVGGGGRGRRRRRVATAEQLQRACARCRKGPPAEAGGAGPSALRLNADPCEARRNRRDCRDRSSRSVLFSGRLLGLRDQPKQKPFRKMCQRCEIRPGWHSSCFVSQKRNGGFRMKLDDNGILLACSSCGTTNRLKYAMLEQPTQCGKCKTALPRPSKPIDVAERRRVRRGRRRRVGACAGGLLGRVVWPVPHDGARSGQGGANATAGRALVLKVDTEANPQAQRALWHPLHSDHHDLPRRQGSAAHRRRATARPFSNSCSNVSRTRSQQELESGHVWLAPDGARRVDRDCRARHQRRCSHRPFRSVILAMARSHSPGSAGDPIFAASGVAASAPPGITTTRAPSSTSR